MSPGRAGPSASQSVSPMPAGTNVESSNNIFIEHISRAEQSGDSSTYYQRWLAALEELALKKGLVSVGELGQHAEQLAAEDDHH